MPTVSPSPIKTLAVSREIAADALSVDKQTVDRLIRANKLRASKLGRRVVIRVADVERLLDENAVQGYGWSLKTPANKGFLAREKRTDVSFAPKRNYQLFAA